VTCRALRDWEIERQTCVIYSATISIPTSQAAVAEFVPTKLIIARLATRANKTYPKRLLQWRVSIVYGAG